MRIFLANYEPDRLGGGWSWQRNFAKCLKSQLSDYNSADIYLIASASMAQKEEVRQAQMDGKKIVLRIDNIIRNSRNRNSGMSRMKLFAELADLVIFQSVFADELLNPYLGAENTTVIHNGCDLDIFKNQDKHNHNHYVYIRSSSDETKNWEMARLNFAQIYRHNHDAVLHLVGKFDSNLEQYNFDFYEGENFIYHGEIHGQNEMADILQIPYTFIYTYFNDACSNSFIEALCCGIDVIHDPYRMAQTGGTPEIYICYQMFGRDYFGLERMGQQYQEALIKL